MKFIGTKTTTHRQEYWDPDKAGYYRLEVVIEEWLHATKGWRAPTRRKRTIPVRRRQIYGVQTTREFKSWR